MNVQVFGIVGVKSLKNYTQDMNKRVLEERPSRRNGFGDR
jgi:hypothetical protein